MAGGNMNLQNKTTQKTVIGQNKKYVTYCHIRDSKIKYFYLVRQSL
jgi:hypothetical protein